MSVAGLIWGVGGVFGYRSMGLPKAVFKRKILAHTLLMCDNYMLK